MPSRRRRFPTRNRASNALALSVGADSNGGRWAAGALERELRESCPPLIGVRRRADRVCR